MNNDSDYIDRLIEENEALSLTRDSLKKEIEDLEKNNPLSYLTVSTNSGILTASNSTGVAYWCDSVASGNADGFTLKNGRVVTIDKLVEDIEELRNRENTLPNKIKKFFKSVWKF